MWRLKMKFIPSCCQIHLLLSSITLGQRRDDDKDDNADVSIVDSRLVVLVNEIDSTLVDALKQLDVDYQGFLLIQECN